MRARTLLVLLSASLPAVLATALREPKEAAADPVASQAQSPERPRRTAPLPARTPDARLAEIAGAWELTSIEDPLLTAPEIRSRGMMLIADGYLSIELHLAAITTDTNQLLEGYFQSGVHRVEIDSLGQLVLDGVLGAEMSADSVFTFEPPGQRRIYGLQTRENELTLNRLERRGRLIFRRVSHRAVPRDIYGREVEVREETDGR